MKAHVTTKTAKSTVWVMALVALCLVLAANTVYPSDFISSSDRYTWSENAGWINFRPSNGGVRVDGDHLSGYAWLENAGWVKLGADNAGPYGNSTTTNWGVNRDGTGNLSGYAWSETWGWINFRPSGGGVVIDPVTKVFGGYAWGENIGWIHLRSQTGAPASYGVAATSTQSGNTGSTSMYAWSENSGWLNVHPTDGGMTVHAGYLSGYVWQENGGWIKLGAGNSGPYDNTTAANWGINRDPSGNLSGYAWSEGWGWINFAPAGGGVTIDPVSGAFNGYAWGENIGWLSFSSPLEFPFPYNVGLAFYTLTLNFTGNGGGTVTSAAPSFSCNTTCSQQILAGSNLRLSAAPAQYSLFGAWSGCDSASGADGYLTVNGDRSATVGFTFDNVHAARIDGPTPLYFPSLQNAYNSPASSGKTIEAWGTDFAETLNCNTAKQVTISGGYDQQYESRPNVTTIRGLSISWGTVIVDGVVVK